MEIVRNYFVLQLYEPKNDLILYLVENKNSNLKMTTNVVNAVRYGNLKTCKLILEELLDIFNYKKRSSSNNDIQFKIYVDNDITKAIYIDEYSLLNNIKCMRVNASFNIESVGLKPVGYVKEDER